MESPQSVEPVARQNSHATELLVNGMTCGNCARHVTEAIQGVSGVRSATVSLENKNATVRWNSGATQDISAIIQAVAAAGYEARPVEASAHDHGGHRQSRWQWNLILGITVTVLLMIGEWVFNLAMTPWFQWLSFALAGAVQIFAGAQFYRGAWNQLKIGSSNMDTLVALGSTTAFGYSAWALLSGMGGHLYFMEAAAIITLISLGHWIEARVSDKAGGALKSLLNLAPQTARRVQSSEFANESVFRLNGWPAGLWTSGFGRWTFRAVCGARFNKDFNAPPALSLTRASIQWPKLMSEMMAAASMK